MELTEKQLADFDRAWFEATAGRDLTDDNDRKAVIDAMLMPIVMMQDEQARMALCDTMAHRLARARLEAPDGPLAQISKMAMLPRGTKLTN